MSTIREIIQQALLAALQTVPGATVLRGKVPLARIPQTTAVLLPANPLTKPT